MQNRRYSILFVLTPSFRPTAGGVQMSTYKLAKWFASVGHTVSIFSFEVSGHIDQDFAVLFRAIEGGRSSSRRNLSELETVFSKTVPDIVINQMPYDHAIGSVLKSLQPRLLIGCLRNTLFSVKNNIDDYGRQILPKLLASSFRTRVGRSMLLQYHRSRHRRDIEKILENHHYFVVFGPPNLDEIRFFKRDVDAAKIKMIPNSVPKVRDKVPAKEKRLLWLGRLTYRQKRADLILPVWERVQSELADWKLDIVGDGPAHDELVLEVARCGVTGVTFHGQSLPESYYSRASIFLMTSSFEGFPNTLIEAQSFGAVPVLFDSFPIARWIVSDRRNGFLIRPFDVAAMSSRIVDLATSAEMIRLQKRALENSRRFHIDTVGKQWCCLFDEQLGVNKQASVD